MRSESKSDQRAREVALPPVPGRLGIRWDDAIAEKTGAITVAAVTPRSAADIAGIRPGDTLLSFAGREVHGAPQFRVNVLAAKSPVPVTLRRSGEAEPVEVTLQLPGDPVRLGISWRTDDAEPGSVIVNRVTSGSPADLAGVRVNDRIYRIDGQPFADGENFRQLATTLQGPLALEIETAGRVRTVEIPAPGAAAEAPANDAAGVSDEAKP